MLMSSLMMSAQSYETVFDTVYNTVAHDLGLDTMDVNISIRDAYFHDGLKPTDNPAACAERINNRSFRIYIYFALDRDRLIRSIIHEFVHVHQMASGRMNVTRRSIIFDGVEYSKSMQWDERPFEIEAINKSDELFNKYFAHGATNV